MLKSLDSGLSRNDALKEFQIFYEIVTFLFRSDWTLAGSGGAYMKLVISKVGVASILGNFAFCRLG